MSGRKRWPEFGPEVLINTTEVRVRFQEVDALRVVWHGHYLSYFEAGRHGFGRQYGFGYDDILAAGFVAPLVHVDIDYLRPARFDQRLTVHSRLHADPGARILFSYDITDDAGERLATGRSVQVFTTPEGELTLTRPDFYERFMTRWADELVRS